MSMDQAPILFNDGGINCTEVQIPKGNPSQVVSMSGMERRLKEPTQCNKHGKNADEVWLFHE